MSSAGSWQGSVMWLCTVSDVYIWNEMATGPCTVTTFWQWEMWQSVFVVLGFPPILPGGHFEGCSSLPLSFAAVGLPLVDSIFLSESVPHVVWVRFPCSLLLWWFLSPTACFGSPQRNLCFIFLACFDPVSSILPTVHRTFLLSCRRL